MRHRLRAHTQSFLPIPPVRSRAEQAFLCLSMLLPFCQRYRPISGGSFAASRVEPRKYVFSSLQYGIIPYCGDFFSYFWLCQKYIERALHAYRAEHSEAYRSPQANIDTSCFSSICLTLRFKLDMFTKVNSICAAHSIYFFCEKMILKLDLSHKGDNHYENQLQRTVFRARKRRSGS